jgi:hypothetical protein
MEIKFGPALKELECENHRQPVGKNDNKKSDGQMFKFVNKIKSTTNPTRPLSSEG